MEKNSIDFYGIKTHNLKDLNINIIKNKITAIYGRSGSGKTSLAYDTIYRLCKDEFDSIESGFFDINDYQLNSYSGVIPAISISQNQYNSNPRSTLYTYLNMYNILSSLKLSEQIPDLSYLKINGFNNQCVKCGGLGVILEIDKSTLVNRSSRLLDNPFNCWKNGSLSSFYKELLISYCKSEGIDVDKNFDQLSEFDQNKLLYGISDEKLSFRCKINGKIKQRKAFYKGAILFSEEHNNLKQNNNFFKEKICSHCNGSRVNVECQKNKILGISFFNFMTLPINSLINELKFEHSNKFILKVLSSIVKMGLGYLSLSRSIPSLSGGEIQKLKFSQLINTEITGVLIVIDEISSQINKIDYQMLLNEVKILSRKNTIILIEHSQFFIDNADFKINIGPKPGVHGGYICEDEVISSKFSIKNRNKVSSFIYYENLSKNNIKNKSVNLPLNCLTAFVGVSGSGKSSLAKAIYEKDDIIYINQRVSLYSNKSILSSSIGVNTYIANYFASKLNLNTDDFLLHKNGGCRLCSGTGFIKHERSYDQDLYIPCAECDGLLFDLTNDNLINNKINGLSIVELYNSEISEILSFFEDKKITSILKSIASVKLDHLKLNRKTQTLSGGEKRRLKLADILARKTKTNKGLIIDEPSAGLDLETASHVLSFIYSKVKYYKYIVIIDHNSEIIKFADFVIEVGPDSGNDGGNIFYKNYNII